MTDEILNIDITHEEKHHISHVVGESRPNVFSELWKDLEWNKSPQRCIPHLSQFSERFENLDANFDCDDLTLSITQESLDALNRLLVFGGYNTLKRKRVENDSGLDFSIRKL